MQLAGLLGGFLRLELDKAVAMQLPCTINQYRTFLNKTRSNFALTRLLCYVIRQACSASRRQASAAAFLRITGIEAVAEHLLCSRDRGPFLCDRHLDYSWTSYLQGLHMLNRVTHQCSDAARTYPKILLTCSLCKEEALFTIWACTTPDILHASCLQEELLDVLLRRLEW